MDDVMMLWWLKGPELEPWLTYSGQARHCPRGRVQDRSSKQKLDFLDRCSVE
ncbi:hypothetical protein BKA81DRAFT_351132 [Phyllosticta paracitricarpa]